MMSISSNDQTDQNGMATRRYSCGSECLSTCVTSSVCVRRSQRSRTATPPTTDAGAAMRSRFFCRSPTTQKKNFHATKPPDGLGIFPEFVTPAEHDALVAVADARLRRRRYEPDHWDAVIRKYREAELADWADADATAAAALRRARDAVERAVRRPDNDDAPPLRFLPPHVIDLREDGRIDPHIDSVKFSGGLVAGLSLLASATMRLDAARPETGDLVEDGHRYELHLAPRSLYVLSGPARFAYAHSVFDISGRRISIILRDAKSS
eukprot:CAMPEP_0185704072 /NCGR_PEP_ID=MMETSP1164-20130828/16207_1 /TAXON_ID=1104430 /ORGANISM="Chrysoreinhardia sp, Strain CCMP2950" /LENGTH=265 /DNA_ID=CAMNT_0028371409 /DNA_START=275 /DNA_END=1068 /DNA_ORIENTATION=-